MYANAGYRQGKQREYFDISRPYIVASAGTYRMLTVPRYYNYYRNRRDYQMLYVANGQAYFTIDGKEHTVTAGQLVLYRPGDYQAYRYHAADRAQVYWMHFTGSEVASLVPSDMPRLMTVGSAARITRLWNLIIEELQLRQEGFEALCSLYLQEMLLLVQRRLHDTGDADKDMREEISAAQTYFSEHYREPIDITAYAVERHVTVGWFIREFRHHVGVTPLQYIIDLRVARARELLTHSDCSVAQVAALVGYDNPLYFSRLFRGRTGMSPLQYRKKGKHTPPPPTKKEQRSS